MAIDRSDALDLTFANIGDRFGTRGGFTAKLGCFSWPVVLGILSTDAGTFTARWRLDGTGESPADDIVERLPSHG